MAIKEKIVEEIDDMPDELLNEVADFIRFLKVKNFNKRSYEITLASEQSLKKDWNKESEDIAWSNL